jgi:hypothetical protein
MADKEIHHVQSDGGAGTGLIAGVLIAAFLAIGLIFFAGGFDFEGSKDLNVNVEPPKIDTPDTGGKG